MKALSKEKLSLDIVLSGKERKALVAFGKEAFPKGTLTVCRNARLEIEVEIETDIADEQDKRATVPVITEQPCNLPTENFQRKNGVA